MSKILQRLFLILFFIVLLNIKTYATSFMFGLPSAVKDNAQELEQKIEAASVSQTVPTAPSNLQAIAVSANQINLTWTDNSDDEIGFKIERKTGSSGTYTQITVVGPVVTSYNNTGLTAGTQYYYRIRAYNSAGDSGYSSEANATTQSSADTTPPAVPTLVSPSNGGTVTTATPSFDWTDVTDPSGVTYELQVDNSGSSFPSPEINQTGLSSSNYTVTTSLSNGTYYWRVRAKDGASTPNYSSWTSVWSFTVTVDTTPIGMVLVPAGNFTMGSTSYSDEQPVHTVYLDAYYIDKYEVTNGQYKQFIDAGGYNNSSYWTTEGWSLKVSSGISQPGFWNNTTFGYSAINGPNLPVVGVSWYEAYAYAKWAGKRLPTEAEWEKAARGTDLRTYPWGNTWSNNYCNWYDGNYGDGTQDGYRYTAPVGSYESGKSPYGCYDMAGNVWEWCNDWYQSGYYASSPASNPPGPATGTYKLLRGGSWDCDFNLCRSTFRGNGHYCAPSDRNSTFGFRCAKSP